MTNFSHSLIPNNMSQSTMTFFTAALFLGLKSTGLTSTTASSSDVQSPLYRPECVAASHSIQPCSNDSSQCQINHSAICVNRNANLSLPLSTANLDIWYVEVFFFSKALFTICTGLTESVQAGCNGASQSDGYKWIFLKQTKLEFALNEVTDCQICFGKAYRVRGAGGSKSPTVSWVYYEEIALNLFAKIKVSFFWLLLGLYWYL